MDTPIYAALHAKYNKESAHRAGVKILQELKDLIPNSHADFDPEEWPKLKDSISHVLIGVLLDIQDSVYRNRTRVEADNFNLGFFLAFETIRLMEAHDEEEKT